MPLDIMRFFLLLLATSLLTACVGAGAIYNHEAAEPGVALSTARARLIRFRPDEDVPVLQKSDLLQAWGKPDSVEVQGNEERWIYHDTLRWNGLMFFVVIPVPLMVPVGHDYVAITFRGDVPVSIETKSEGSSGAICPVIKNVHTLELGCDVQNGPGEGKIDGKFFARGPGDKILGGLKKDEYKRHPDDARPIIPLGEKLRVCPSAELPPWACVW